MAFGFRSVEKTKIVLIEHHILKLEILDDLFGTKVACDEFSHYVFVFVSVLLEPLNVCHKGIIAKKSERLYDYLA